MALRSSRLAAGGSSVALDVSVVLVVVDLDGWLEGVPPKPPPF